MKKYLNKFLLVLIIVILGIPSLLLNDIVTAQGLGNDIEDTQEVDEVRSVTIKEKVSGLKMKVPDNLSVDGFNNVSPKDFVINWSKSIILTPGEIMGVSVWNRNTKKEINQVYKQITEMDGCRNYDPTSICMINFPAKPNQMSVYSKYFKFDTSLVRVSYSFSHLYEVSSFKAIANTIQVNGIKQFQKVDYKILNKNKQTRDPSQVRGATNCGGFSDTNNPYDCCYSSIPGQQNANCTWYAAYKRPDLKGIINKWPEGLFTQAYQAGVPVSYDKPVPGSLIVWQLHVAYVESVGPNSVTWSEQNCYTNNNPYNPSITKYSYTPDYAAGNFIGYVLPQGGSSSYSACSGTNISKSNWNQSGPLTCTPVSSITIQPESNLRGSNGDINIKPN